MWLVYAVALLLGGGILLVQLLSGHHGHGYDVGHGPDSAAGDHHPHQGPGLMSIRSLSYGVFAFGFVGGSLHLLGLAGPTAALATGLATGAATTVLVGLAFRQLSDPSASGEAGFHETRGSVGRVIVSCARGRPGKVRVSLKGQAVDMLATTDDESIPAGAEVVITEVRDAVVHVTRARQPEHPDKEAS